METEKQLTSSKRYYWMKLQTDFFNQDATKVLRRQQNGAEYLVVLLKMCLKSVEREPIGVLMFTETIPHTPDTLSVVLDEDIEHIRATLAACKHLGIITIADDQAICIDMVNEMVGSIGESALRMRKLRARRQKQLVDNRHNVTDKASQSDEELEIEIDKEGDPLGSTPFLSNIPKDDFDKAIKRIRDTFRKRTGESIRFKNTTLLRDIKTLRYDNPNLLVRVYFYFLNKWSGSLDELKADSGRKHWRIFIKQDSNGSEWLVKYNRDQGRVSADSENNICPECGEVFTEGFEEHWAYGCRYADNHVIDKS